MPVIECNTDAEYRQHFGTAGQKPVIVDFSAAWCGPCRNIAPLYEQLSSRYPGMLFLKVDVDKCEETAAANSVNAMPTFMVFVGQKKVDQLQGANEAGLEKMVDKWSKMVAAEADTLVPGQLELSAFFENPQIECLNGCDDTPVRQFLQEPSAVLRSDCDEQLILTIPFIQPVKLHSIFVKGVGSKAPKKIRIFSNLPKTLDFDDAMGVEPVQIVELGEAAGKDGEVVNLKFVKFQNVRNVQLFIENNQEEGEVTEVEQIKFYGSPVNATTNMDNFKRVSGKKGEHGY